MPDHVRVNKATERLATLFTIASNQTFPVQNKGNFCRKRLWYGPLCRSARTKYHVAKRRFNEYKSSSNRQLLTEANRNYKKKKKKKIKKMNKYIAKHRKYNENKLRNLQ